MELLGPYYFPDLNRLIDRIDGIHLRTDQIYLLQYVKLSIIALIIRKLQSTGSEFKQDLNAFSPLTQTRFTVTAHV